jgi:hypothetical protein
MPYIGIIVFIIAVTLISILIYSRKFLSRSLGLINMGV